MRQLHLIQFRILPWFGILFFTGLFFGSCGASLDEKRAIELIRLNYKQQNSIGGEGTWFLDSVVVDKITRTINDSLIAFRVIAHTSGLYKLPVIEDAPSGYTERFRDTLQFIARKYDKVWMADDWTIIGSRHE